MELYNHGGHLYFFVAEMDGLLTLLRICGTPPAINTNSLTTLTPEPITCEACEWAGRQVEAIGAAQARLFEQLPPERGGRRVH